MIEQKDRPVKFKNFHSIIKEFFKALGNPYTYNIKKNGYLLFGILWGIPVPVVTIWTALYYKGLAISTNTILTEITTNHLHLFFLMHPVLFGIVFGAMGTVRDDKEMARLGYEKNLIEINKKLKDTNKRLQEIDELKDNFLSMVSHELWSPLATIQGYVTFLKEEKSGVLNEEQKETLGIVEEQADHLSHLIEELVDLSKIETGKFEVKLDRLDMSKIVAKCVNSLKQAAEEKKIVLKNDLLRKVAHVMADRKRITQVLTNLLGNAMKFMPEKGEISVSAREKKDTVEFSITDMGVGIPEDKINRIFDKFYQVDSANNRSYGGCGLGLAITKSIIEMHKGKIWVESKVGVGSKFSFELKKCSVPLDLSMQTCKKV